LRHSVRCDEARVDVTTLSGLSLAALLQVPERRAHVRLSPPALTLSASINRTPTIFVDLSVPSAIRRLIVFVDTPRRRAAS
jgi:hypothetical protein